MQPTKKMKNTNTETVTKKKKPKTSQSNKNIKEKSNDFLKSPDGKSQISLENFIKRHADDNTLDIINACFIFQLCNTCRLLLKWQKQYDQSEKNEDRYKESEYYYVRLFEIAEGKGVVEKGWNCLESVQQIKDNLKVHSDVLQKEISKQDKDIDENILLQIFGESKSDDSLFNVKPEYFWNHEKISRKRKIMVIRQIAHLCSMGEAKHFSNSEFSRKTQAKALEIMNSSKSGKKINPIKERFVCLSFFLCVNFSITTIMF